MGLLAKLLIPSKNLGLPLQGLTPLTLGQNQTIAAAMGALWGFGHSSGQLILGLVFILLKVGNLHKARHSTVATRLSSLFL